MDNFSHAVASLAVSACIHRSLPAETDAHRHTARHRLLLVASLLAGNLPDLDLVLTWLLPAPLGYLLHHRGHTHTAPRLAASSAAVGIGLVVLACRKTVYPRERGGVVGPGAGDFRRPPAPSVDGLSQPLRPPSVPSLRLALVFRRSGLHSRAGVLGYLLHTSCDDDAVAAAAHPRCRGPSGRAAVFHC